jgi:predicted nucleic acid-binding protein
VAGYGQSLLLDWSAYTRVLLARTRATTGRRLSVEQLERFEAAVRADELHVCSPFRLEARYSARSAEELIRLTDELGGFRSVGADGETWSLAERSQEALASSSQVSHRVKLADLLVAAIAHQHGLGVLHYDDDYAAIADHGGLRLENRWIAPPGAVD